MTKRHSGLEDIKENHDIKSEEEFLLKLLQKISQRLKKEYAYFDEQLLAICTKEEKIIMIPIEIFAQNLCPSEALTKYLKEEHNLNYHEISVMINRNERGVWANYQRALKKKSSRFKVKNTFSIPVHVFQDKELSVLECLVRYLKQTKYIKNSKIAKLLNKNPSNTWTIYNRAERKKLLN